MDAAKLRAVAQLQQFFDATQGIQFTDSPDESDRQRHEHMSCVLKRLSYTGPVKGERWASISRAGRSSCTSHTQTLKRSKESPWVCSRGIETCADSTGG